MSWDGINRGGVFLGEIARPFCIVFIALVMGAGLFFTAVTYDKLGILAGAFAALIGARSWENQTKIKADAVVKTKETEMTGRPAVQTIADAANPPPPTGAPQ